MAGLGPSFGTDPVTEANDGTAENKAASTPPAIAIALIPDLIALLIGTALNPEVAFAVCYAINRSQVHFGEFFS